MELRLLFEFETEEFDFQRITIINPLRIPSQGEIVSLRWEDFVTDPDEVSALEEFEVNDSFIADIVSTRYTKDYVRVFIILCSEKIYLREMTQRDRDRFKNLQQET